MKIHQSAAEQALEHNHEQCSLRGLWVAVLLQAVEDWQSSRIRQKKAAEKFLFENRADFDQVCAAAGLVPQSVRSSLSRMKNTISTTVPIATTA